LSLKSDPLGTECHNISPWSRDKKVKKNRFDSYEEET